MTAGKFQTCRYVGAISATVLIRPLLRHRRKPGELGGIPLVMLGLSAVTFVVSLLWRERKTA